MKKRKKIKLRARNNNNNNNNNNVKEGERSPSVQNTTNEYNGDSLNNNNNPINIKPSAPIQSNQYISTTNNINLQLNNQNNPAHPVYPGDIELITNNNNNNNNNGNNNNNKGNKKLRMDDLSSTELNEDEDIQIPEFASMKSGKNYYKLRYIIIRDMTPGALIILGLSILFVWILTKHIGDVVIDSATNKLTESVEHITQITLKSASTTIENEFKFGIDGYMLPSSYAIIDSIRKCDQCKSYSFQAPSTKIDTQTGHINRLIALNNNNNIINGVNINNTKSSVMFSDQISVGIDNKLTSYSYIVEKTSHLEHLGKFFFNSNSNKNYAFLTFTDSVSKMYRQFPGTITNRENDVNFKPSETYIYTGAVDTSLYGKDNINSKEMPLYPMKLIFHSQPYIDIQLNNQYVIELSKAIFNPKAECSNLGIVECLENIESSGLFGVVSIKFRQTLLQDIINSFEFSTYLWSYNNQIVYASNRINYTSEFAPFIKDVNIVLNNKFTTSMINIMKENVKGTKIWYQQYCQWKHVLDSKYIITTCQEYEPIIKAIDNQVSTIQTSTKNAFNEAIIITILCAVLFAVLATFATYYAIYPLKKVTKLAIKFSDTIGDKESYKNFEVSESDVTLTGPVELKHLQYSFLQIIRDIIDKRLHPIQVYNVVNPFYKRINEFETKLSTSNKELLNAIDFIRTRLSDIFDDDDDDDDDERKHIDDNNVEKKTEIIVEQPPNELMQSHKNLNALPNRFIENGIRLKFLLNGIFCILLIIMLIVISITSAKTDKDSIDWIAPVRTSLITKQENTIEQQLVTLNKLTASFLSRLSNTFETHHKAIEEIYNAAYFPSTTSLELLSNYDLYFSPINLANAPSINPYAKSQPQSALKVNKRTNGLANFNTAALYSNGKKAYSSQDGYLPPWQDTSWSNTLSKHQNLSHTDNTMRSLYLSNSEVRYIYFALEDESVKLYPYRDLSAFTTWTGRCTNPLHLANQRTGYTPICRDWYWKAKNAAVGETIWNQLILSASTNALLLTISQGLYDANNNFFGVAAIDFGVDQLQQILDYAKETSDSSYAYILDKDLNVIIHHKTLGSSEINNIIDVDFNTCNSISRNFFLTQIKSQMLAKNTVYGMKIDPCNSGDIWYLSFSPIESTSYLIALMIPKSEIEASADDLQSTVDATVAGTISGCVIGFVILMFIGYKYVQYFTNKILVPIDELKQFISKLEKGDYSNNPKANLLIAREIYTLYQSLEAMLVALRFGNTAAWSDNNVVKILDNYMKALSMMRFRDKSYGIGVCYNNIGLCLRKMEQAAIEKKKKKKIVRKNSKKLNKNKKFDKDPLKYFLNAIVIARKEYNQNQNEANGQILSERLFNIALFYCDVNNTNMMAIALNECLNLSIQYDKHLLLTRFSYALALYLEDSLDNKLHEPSESKYAVCREFGLAFAKQALNEHLEELSGSDIGKILFTLYILSNNQIEWVLLALDSIKQLDDYFIFCRLALHAKLRVHSLTKPIDAIMTEDNKIKWKTGTKFKDFRKAFSIVNSNNNVPGRAGSSHEPLDVIFVLDVSGSMYGSRIKTCIESIKAIIERLNISKDEDRVAMFTFNNHVNTLFTLNEGISKENILLKLNNIRASSGTAFYDALNYAVSEINASKIHKSSSHQWIIALTDGDDNMSYYLSASQFLKFLVSGAVNFACITVDLGDNSSSAAMIKKFVQQTVESGKNGLHLDAKNTADIANSFVKIQNLMLEDSSRTMQQFL